MPVRKSNSKELTLPIRADPAATPQSFLPTSMTAPPQSTPRQAEVKTPKDIKYLDFVLGGRLTPDNKDGLGTKNDNSADDTG